MESDIQVELTPEEHAFLARLVSNLTVNPMQPDAEKVVSLVKSIAVKLDKSVTGTQE